MSFPLYENLSKNIEDKDLTILEKREIVKKISAFNSDAHELIYVLIKCFQINNDSNDNNLSIPYNGNVIKENIEFDLLQLPNKLKQLLYKFVLMHEKRCHEEQQMKEAQDSVLEDIN